MGDALPNGDTRNKDVAGIFVGTLCKCSHTDTWESKIKYNQVNTWNTKHLSVQWVCYTAKTVRIPLNTRD